MDLQPEPSEQDEHHEQQHVVTDGRETPPRQLRIEAHAALLPEAAAGEPATDVRCHILCAGKGLSAKLSGS